MNKIHDLDIVSDLFHVYVICSVSVLEETADRLAMNMEEVRNNLKNIKSDLDVEQDEKVLYPGLIAWSLVLSHIYVSWNHKYIPQYVIPV